MLWLKAFHVIAMVCWFAGLFYLPRLFVYHAQSTDTLSIERFKVMERKLYRGIMWPSLVLTFVFGFAMIANAPDYYLAQHWLHAKLVLVGKYTIYFVAINMTTAKNLTFFSDSLMNYPYYCWWRLLF